MKLSRAFFILSLLMIPLTASALNAQTIGAERTPTNGASTSPLNAMFGLKLGASLPKNVAVVKPLQYHEVIVVPPARMQTFPQCVVFMDTNDIVIAAIESTGIVDEEQDALRIFNNLSVNFSKQCGKPEVIMNLQSQKLHKWVKESHDLLLGLRESADSLAGRKNMFWIDIELVDRKLEPPKDEAADERDSERKLRKTR
jgi:hypothetical protein